MFDIGFWELAVIGAIMLVVLGPERLPGVARTAGFWMSKLRRMVTDVKREVKREMDAAELKELEDAKNQIEEASKSVHSKMNSNILSDTKVSEKNTANNAVKDSGEASKSTSPDQTTQEEQPEKTTDDSGKS